MVPSVPWGFIVRFRVAPAVPWGFISPREVLPPVSFLAVSVQA